MIRFLGLDIGKAIESALEVVLNWIKMAFFAVIKLLFVALDAFMDIVFKLAGFSNLDSGENLLSMFFSNTNNGSSNAISNLYFYICLACAVLMLFFAVIQIIKQDFFSEGGGGSHAPIFKKMFIGLLWFIAIPPVFVFAVDIVAGLVAALMRVDTFAQIGSMSQTIFELCLEKPTWVGDTNPIPHWDAITPRDFVALTNIYDFNVLVFVAVIGMTFYSMFMLSFGLVKRIITLVFLYVMGPIAISQSVMDGGGRMKTWQKDVVSEFTSVFGTIISLVLLFMFITQVVGDLNFFNVENLSGIPKAAAIFANALVKGLFIIVAFDMIKKGDVVKKFISTLTVNDSQAAFATVAKGAATATGIAKTAAMAPVKATQFAVKAGSTAVGLAMKETRADYAAKLKTKLPTFDGFRTSVQLEKVEAARKAKDEARVSRSENNVGRKGISFSTKADAGTADYAADATKFADNITKTNPATVTSKKAMENNIKTAGDMLSKQTEVINKEITAKVDNTSFKSEINGKSSAEQLAELKKQAESSEQKLKAYQNVIVEQEQKIQIATAAGKSDDVEDALKKLNEARNNIDRVKTEMKVINEVQLSVENKVKIEKAQDVVEKAKKKIGDQSVGSYTGGKLGKTVKENSAINQDVGNALKDVFGGQK